MIFIDTGAFLARRKALMITNKSHGPATVAATDVSKGDSSAIRHDVRLRPWIGDILTALVIAHFFHFYGWIAGTISLLIGIGLRRKRFVGIARKVHPVAWLCLASFIVTFAALVTVQEYRTYQARQFSRAVTRVGGTTMTHDGIQFLGPTISNSNLHAVSQFTDTTSLELHSTRVTDDGIALIGNWRNLRGLFLSNNPLTDRSLDIIRHFDKLEWLELGGTQITDAGLTKLAELEALKKLNLTGCTKVTQSGIKRLQSALPTCDIEWSAEPWVSIPDPAE